MAALPRWSERLALLLLAAVLLPGATSAAANRLSGTSAEAAVTITPVVPSSAAAAPPGAAEAAGSAVPSPVPGSGPQRAVGSATRTISSQVQAVAIYGSPGIPIMGALGRYSADDAAREVRRLAAEWDAANGDRETIGVLHLITAVAQPTPMADGSYLTRLGPETIGEYVEAARRHGVLLILDVQVGMADPLAEAQRLEPFLIEPFVHLALDPEFAMHAKGSVPGRAIGSLDATQVNPVQRYLAALVRREGLPVKALVLHQFMASMLTGTEGFEDLPEVSRIVDMDGWGNQEVKLAHYEAYALASYSQRPAIKLFYDWDEPLLSMEMLLSLHRIPDLVIYQ